MRQRWPYSKSPAKGAVMNRWTSLLSALLLVLMLWTGEAAHAAEQLECIPVSAEAADHFDGDSDQTSPDQEQGAAHHHSGCSGHQAAATLDVSALGFFLSDRVIPRVTCAVGELRRDPDTGLRPPIAVTMLSLA